MKKLVLAAFCLLALNASAQKNHAPYTDKNRFTGLDTAIEHALKTWHAAGLAVAVVYKKQVIYAKGFGYRDVEHKLPVTANTGFAIGSCSKAFTATLIGLLQKDGKVDLDKPVTTYMPSLRFYNNEMTNNITLRDMMSHRTGLPRHDMSWYFFPTDSKDSLIQRIQYQEPTEPLRQTWQYNNFMFMAQGAIVEKITGKSWAENIRERFFIPLGMSNSNTSIEELEKSGEPAIGYEVYHDSIIRKQQYFHIRAMEPAGAINSSVNDMAKWVTTWINDGKFEGKEIIPANYYTQAISSQMVIAGALPTKDRPDLYLENYGFGWFLSSYKGHYRVEHGGNIDGFSASTSFFPSDSVGIIVLTNQNASQLPAIVRNLVADRMLGQKYFDWSGDMKRAQDKAVTDGKKIEKEKKSEPKKFPATHALADYTGNYSNAGYGALHAFIQHDSLFIRGVNNTLWMCHDSYDIFDAYLKDKTYGIDTAEAMVKFQYQMNISGDIESISCVLEGQLKPIVFTKGLDAKPLTAAELQKYTGEYTLSGLTVKVYLKDRTLYALVPGQPEYELVPLGADKFGLKVLSGYYLQFNANSSGVIAEAVFMQPNGNFKAVKSK